MCIIKYNIIFNAYAYEFVVKLPRKYYKVLRHDYICYILLFKRTKNEMFYNIYIDDLYIIT